MNRQLGPAPAGGAALRHRLADVLLLVGAGALAAAIPATILDGSAAKELPWIAGGAAFLGCAAVVWWKRRGDAAAWWFAVAGGLVALTQAFDGVVLRVAVQGPEAAVAWVVLGMQLAMAFGGIAIAHLIGLLPNGVVERPLERRVLRALWFLPLLPPLVLLGRPTLLPPSYHMLGELPNPYAIGALEPIGAAAGTAVAALQGVFVVGVALLLLRYRRSDAARRRRIRWLLLPAMFATAVAVADLVLWRLFPEGSPGVLATVGLSALWILAIASLPAAIAVAVLRPDLLDVDQLLRKSFVYGVLWALIAAGYVGVAAGLGLAAGRHLPLGLAIVLTVAATLVVHPARRWLERIADERVFGTRADPAAVVSRLGAALEDTIEVERLLPRIADTLQEGLGLRWVRVRLEPAAPVNGDHPVLTVPIMLGEERLGVVECGPKESGVLTDDDKALVATLARQAALAVRNVRLTAELEASRLRLVRAQDAERRRIERNIHDGIQQDLVALIGATAHGQSMLRRDPDAGEAALAGLHDGLRRVLTELRELARGIHPSLLSDRGLLDAVEALAARSAMPVSVRADPSLRGLRFAEEVEGAGYFAVAEALANAGKHAAAAQAEVSLARSNGSLHITVTDNGAGFDPAAAVGGNGLAGLAERLAALGGRLDVSSRAGAGTTVRAVLRVADD